MHRLDLDFRSLTEPPIRGVRRRLRRLLRVTLFLLAAAFGSPARAQSCHVSAASQDTTFGVRLSARAQTAGFETTLYEGHYQGLFAGVLAGSETVSAEASLPFYRIMRNGLTSYGAGDLALGARAKLFGYGGDRGATGLFVAGTLPTGDPERDLGMGHVMIMPGAWGRASLRPVVFFAELAYGAALGTQGAGHHEHHAAGQTPIVNPMNSSELEPLVAVAVDVAGPFRVRGGAYGGFPVGSSDGASRMAAFVAVEIARGSFGASVQGELPLVGDPFTSRLSLELSTRL
jgi:hypothetical protein